tara:strand:- start:201 stop:1145 length:945 start_codon:yes stop_codon:yes gene_type:complete
MALSYQEHTTANGVSYAYSFDAVSHDTTNIKLTIGGKHLYDGVSKYNTSTRLLDDTGSVQSAEYTVSGTSSGGTISILTSVNITGIVTNGVPTLSTTQVLRVYRQTNRTTAEVSFSSDSVLTDTDLNTSANQARFLSLEAVDRADESISIDQNDTTQFNVQISGNDKRIFGVANPNNSNDVANKAYVDTATLGTLTGPVLISPVLNTTVTGTAIDTDLSSTSGSDDTLASAKAIKAYVDAQIATEDTIAELNDTTITGTPADNEVLAYDTSASKWINQTSTEAGLASITYSDTGDTTTEANALSNSIVFSIALG